MAATKWIDGLMVCKVALMTAGDAFLVVDKDGGRCSATDLEVALWRRLYGEPPMAPSSSADRRKR